MPTPPRYSRQVLFEGIGAEGQERLMAARATVVGCGALGAMQASLLARAGVGRLRIIDRDFVEESNLQRQVLFDEEDARTAQPKAAAAAAKLSAANSLVEIEAVVDDLNPATARRLLEGSSLVLDATDNFDARYLINDWAVCSRTPWIYGGCVGAYGLTFTIVPGETACLRCVFETAPPAGSGPSCDTAGIVGPIVGVIASMQAAEALKLLCGRGDINRRMRRVDLWENRFDEIGLPAPGPGCPCCGRGEFPYLEGKLGAAASGLCGRDSVQLLRPESVHLDLEEVARRLEPLGAVQRNRFLLRARVGGHQITLFPDGRAIIGGTRDPAVAKSLYARYIGS